MLARDPLTGYLHEVPDYWLHGPDYLSDGLGDGLGFPLAPLIGIAAQALPGIISSIAGGAKGGGGAAPAAAAGPAAAGGAPIVIPVPQPQLIPIPIPVPYPVVRVPVPVRELPGGVLAPVAPGTWPGAPVPRKRVRRRRRR